MTVIDRLRAILRLRRSAPKRALPLHRHVPSRTPPMPRTPDTDVVGVPDTFIAPGPSTTPFDADPITPAPRAFETGGGGDLGGAGATGHWEASPSPPSDSSSSDSSGSDSSSSSSSSSSD